MFMKPDVQPSIASDPDLMREREVEERKVRRGGKRNGKVMQMFMDPVVQPSIASDLDMMRGKEGEGEEKR